MFGSNRSSAWIRLADRRRFCRRMSRSKRNFFFSDKCGREGQEINFPGLMIRVQVAKGGVSSFIFEKDTGRAEECLEKQSVPALFAGRE